MQYLLFIIAAHLGSSGEPARDWPQWRGPRRSGTWEGVKLPERLDERHVERRWRAELGGGYSGIAVAGGRVYTMDRAGARERLVCLERDSGKVLWTHEYLADYGDMAYANGPRSTPTVDEGRVFAQGAAGHTHAVDAASGQVLWSHDFAAALGGKTPEWGHAASPLVWRDLVLIQAGGRPGPTLVAFEKVTGKERWRALDDKPGYSSPVIIDVGGKPQVCFWSAENVAGVVPATGEVLWRVPYKSTYDVAIMSPVFHEGVLLVSGFWEGSKALRPGGPSGPEEVWGGKSLSCLMSTPLYRDGYLYALDKDQGLLCVEWRTGRIVWSDSHRVTPKARNPQAALVWAGERAVILNELGELILSRLEPRGYEELGRVPIIGKTWAHPAYAGQDVFARSDTEIVCVRVKP